MSDSTASTSPSSANTSFPACGSSSRSGDDDPGLYLGVFLAIRQAHHHGYTVWATTSAYRRISYCDHPIDACDEILRFGIEFSEPRYTNMDADFECR